MSLSLVYHNLQVRRPASVKVTGIVNERADNPCMSINENETPLNQPTVQTCRLFSAGRERIFGEPPGWLKEILANDPAIE